MVWTCYEERPGVRRKKSDGNEVTGKEEKREAEEKISLEDLAANVEKQLLAAKILKHLS